MKKARERNLNFWKNECFFFLYKKKLEGTTIGYFGNDSSFTPKKFRKIIVKNFNLKAVFIGF